MMTLSEKQALFCENVSYLIQEIHRQGLRCTFGEAFRTPEQAALYAQEGKGIVHSLHCERMAIDLNLFTTTGTYLTDPKEWEPFGSFWKRIHPHNRWGGDFIKLGGKIDDSNHFEMQLD